MDEQCQYCLCCAADPFLNDQNFVLSVLSLEELGATGNKGLAGLTGNPVLANGIAALATSATAQATVQRMLLWQMHNYTVEPFNETVQQVFARVSALRDSLDGPQVKTSLKWNTDVFQRCHAIDTWALLATPHDQTCIVQLYRFVTATL